MAKINLRHYDSGDKTLGVFIETTKTTRKVPTAALVLHHVILALQEWSALQHCAYCAATVLNRCILYTNLLNECIEKRSGTDDLVHVKKILNLRKQRFQMNLG